MMNCMDESGDRIQFDAVVAEQAPAQPDLSSYSTIIVAFSGGKDSVACVLQLLERGVPRHKIELWHHDIDGREGSELMDWPCTRDYCRAFAHALGLRIFYSWKVGGFEREMLRNNVATAPTRFETPEGAVRQVGGTSGKLGTRLKFPQVSADLTVRWCSAYLKIDVCAAAIRNQERFAGRRTLIVSGERAEESSARAKYAAFEADRTDRRDGRDARHVDRWRAVHAWSEREVWAIIERHRINPHPAYRLGWGRVSCATCIFGSPSQWASAAAVLPDQVARVASYEDQFGVTIKRGKRVRDLVVLGQPYAAISETDAAAARSRTFNEPIVLEPEAWRLPAGAYGESCGPT